MPVSLTAGIPQSAFPVGAGATSTVAWTYNVLDTTGVAGVLATSPVWSTRPGHVPTLVMTPRVPVGNAALAVSVAYTYSDVNLNAISTGTVDSFNATSGAAARTMTLPAAPDGARYWFVQLLLNEGVSEIVRRTNLFPAPRPDYTANYMAGYFAARSRSYALYGPGPYVAGVAATNLTTAIAHTGTALTATYTGFNIYQAIDASTPTAALGCLVTALVGQSVTFSCYVASTKAVTAAAAVRFVTAGGAWVAAATSGTATAVPATASTYPRSWTRLSVTVTVPAGAQVMAAAVWVPASTAWAAVDDFAATGFMIEASATLNDWFDGSYSPTTYWPRWTGTTAASTSELYTPGQPRGRSLVLSAVTANVAAGASEIVAATLERDLRRTVIDVLNKRPPLITIGTPGLQKGQITYLCDDLPTALAVDVLYQFAGTITLNTGSGGALNGFAHMAVEKVSLSAEKAIPGRPSKWLVTVAVREVAAS